ncbi:hypothetical protein ISS30_04745 [bacterium]|nr:hypothetical protein [bacterium]
MKTGTRFLTSFVFIVISAALSKGQSWEYFKLADEPPAGGLYINHEQVKGKFVFCESDSLVFYKWDEDLSSLVMDPHKYGFPSACCIDFAEIKGKPFVLIGGRAVLHIWFYSDGEWIRYAHFNDPPDFYVTQCLFYSFTGMPMKYDYILLRRDGDGENSDGLYYYIRNCWKKLFIEDSYLYGKRLWRDENDHSIIYMTKEGTDMIYFVDADDFPVFKPMEVKNSSYNKNN